MNQKIFIANIVLLIVILFLGYLVATTHYIPPAEGITLSPTIPLQDGSDDSENPAGVNLNGETIYQKSSPNKEVAQLTDRYPRFGESPIFDTIVPKPTPPPTPTPKPRVPPDINKITARWKLSSIFGNSASFQDSGTKTDWSMNIGETYDVVYRNEKCAVKLEKINEDKFEVIISYEDQQRTLSMF
ncbi:hypothetical protein JW926_08570 [Candidatus Sumerlaeota bacterium]|nr:hypothetical protein [Candidatus Sumerlaeota bacterium]